MPRRKIIAGNWKMNMLPNEAMDFITRLSEGVRNVKSEIVLCVPYTDLLFIINCSKHKHKNRCTKYALGRNRSIHRRSFRKNA